MQNFQLTTSRNICGFNIFDKRDWISEMWTYLYIFVFMLDYNYVNFIFYFTKSVIYEGFPSFFSCNNRLNGFLPL